MWGAEIKGKMKTVFIKLYGDQNPKGKRKNGNGYFNDVEIRGKKEVVTILKTMHEIKNELYNQK